MANNRNHSFYREQEKSILGQQKWTTKRIGKLSWTILKWCLWGFLIIATLWGCVNEFIIHTSNNLGQGVEFYQANDFVYPNTYQAINVVGYTASSDMVNPDVISYDSSKAPTYTTEPFNFMVVNPDYKNDDADSDANTTDYYISAADANEMYAYNLNQLTALGTGIYMYDHSDVSGFNSDAWYVPSNSIPTFLKNEAQEEIDGKNLDKEHDYNVTNATSYVYYLADKADGELDGVDDNKKLIDYVASYKKDSDGNDKDYSSINNVSSWNAVPMLKADKTEPYDQLSNWTAIHNLTTTWNEDKDKDYKQEALNNQIKIAINKEAFNSGKGTATYDDLANDIVDQSNGTTLQQKYETTASENGLDISDAQSYKADFTIANSKTSKTTYGGAETMVISIQKGFPVRISQASQDFIDGTNISGLNNSTTQMRKDNFQNWDTSKSSNQYGFDTENQMYGWTLLDASYGVNYLGTSTEDAKKTESEYVGKSRDYQADLLRVYDDAASAATNDVYSDLNEDNAFYADQRRQDWGIVKDGETSSDYTVMDQKIKSWMTDDVYMHMVGSSTVGGESVTYNYGSKFAGMTSMQQITNIGDNVADNNGRNDLAFTGVLPRIDDETKNDKTYETSIFSDSIIPTRQDSWGESRVTFIGWKDWGKAWDVQYGPLYGAFVFPLAQLAMGIGEIFHYAASAWGVIVSIIVIVFLTRGLGALLSFKGTANQMKMQEVQTDVAKIKAKYSKYDLKEEPRMKQKQQQEIMALYRKKEINPMGSLGTIFITMPIFISLWIIISSLPAYKVVFMGHFTWAVSSWYGVFHMGWLFILYLLIGASVGLVQGVSSKVPTWLGNKRKGIKTIDEATKAAQKKQNKTQNIMIGVFVFMGLTVPALFAFYWICSGFFTIILELCKHSWKVHVANEMKKDHEYQTPMARFKHKMKATFKKA